MTATHAFASFNYPRPVAFLHPGSLKTRLARWKTLNSLRVARGLEPYQPGRTSNSWKHTGAVVDASRGLHSFYLEHHDMPAKRYSLAHEVSDGGVKHTGWYLDDSCTDTVCGVVFHLSGGRMLVGWTMGQGMLSAVDTKDVYTDARDAAYTADAMAAAYAERCREHTAREQAEF